MSVALKSASARCSHLAASAVAGVDPPSRTFSDLTRLPSELGTHYRVKLKIPGATERLEPPISPDSLVEGDGCKLSVPLHGQAPAGALNKQPIARGGVAFRNLDVVNEPN